MTSEKITYVVSDSPDRIEPTGEDVPSQYQTPEEAGDAIKNDWHGGYGRKYVLAVKIVSVVAEYDRPWSIVRKDDHEHVFSLPEPDEFCVGTSECTMTYAEYLRMGDTGHA